MQNKIKYCSQLYFVDCLDCYLESLRTFLLIVMNFCSSTHLNETVGSFPTNGVLLALVSTLNVFKMIISKCG